METIELNELVKKLNGISNANPSREIEIDGRKESQSQRNVNIVVFEEEKYYVSYLIFIQ